MVHDDNLGIEFLGILSGVVSGIGSDVSSLDILDGKTLDVETNIVSGNSLRDMLVMHLDGFARSGGTERSETNFHIWLDDTSLDSTNWYSSDTGDLVDILEWESEWLENWSLWWLDGVQSIKEAESLVPWHLVGGVNHVISNPS